MSKLDEEFTEFLAKDWVIEESPPALYQVLALRSAIAGIMSLFPHGRGSGRSTMSRSIVRYIMRKDAEAR